MLDPFQAENPDDVAHLAELQRDIHDGFKTLVPTAAASACKLARRNCSTAPLDRPPGRGFGLGRRLGDLRTVMRDEFGPKCASSKPPQTRLLARLGLGRSAAGAALGADLLDG